MSKMIPGVDSNGSFTGDGRQRNEIPKIIWGVVNDKMLTWKKNRKKSKGQGRDSDAILLRSFCYNVNEGAWSSDCGCKEAQNLFFEYISKTKGKWKSKGSISDDYISVQFGTSIGSGPSYDYQSDLIREEMLRMGLKSPTGDNFQLLGCSNSQVRNYTFLFRRISQGKNENESQKLLRSILPTLDDLEKNKGVAKRVKYAGLLFSGVKRFVRLPQNTIIQEIPSIERNDFDFTDGTGLISLKLARYIAKQMNLQGNIIPSVFQIRYGGCVMKKQHSNHHQTVSSEAYVCKGILLVDPAEEEKYIISFRTSMEKVPLAQSNTSDWTKCMNHTLGIVDFSQNRIGKLNQQLLCLLSENVPHDELRSIQNFHLDQVKNSWHDPFALGYISAMEAANNHERFWDYYEQLILGSNTYGYKRLPSAYVTLTQKRSRFCNEDGKLQIHLGQSRTVFGTAFPEELGDILEEGQCLFFTDQGLLVDTIIVSRSPSYTPGDVRVLNSIKLPDCSGPLHQLRNCIIFSTKGNRPEADKMSGGDMDGDQFLVIWDKRLTKHANRISKEEPADYSPPPKTNYNASKKKDWIDYLSIQDNSMLGIVDRAFYNTAKEKGIKSQEAKKLNSIFASLVDKNPTSLRELERLSGSSYILGNKMNESSSSIWEEMLEYQLQCGRNMREYGKMTPDLNDYQSFQENLLRDSSTIVKNIEAFKGHFKHNIGLEKLESFLQAIHEKYLSSNCLGHMNYEYGSAFSTKADLDEKFKAKCADWEKNAHEVFASALAKWDCEREKLLKDLEKERTLKEQQLNAFEREYEHLERSYGEAIKKSLSDLHSKLSSEYHKEKERLLELKHKHQQRYELLCKESQDLEQKIGEMTEEEIQKLNSLMQTQKILIQKIEKELQNLPWSPLSLIGFDSEKNAITKRLSKLQDDQQKCNLMLSKVIELKKLFKTEKWRFYGFIESDSCFKQIGKKWKTVEEEKVNIQDEITNLEEYLYELNGFQKEFLGGEWRNEGKMYHIFKFGLRVQVPLNKIWFERSQDIIKKEILYIQKKSKSLDTTLERLNERREAFLNGDLWKCLDFDAKKIEAKLKQEEIKSNNLEAELEGIKSKLDDIFKKEELSKNYLCQLQKELLHLNQFKQQFESFLESESDLMNFFDGKMMTQSSYMNLYNLVSKGNDQFWTIIIEDYFRVVKGLDHSRLEENPHLLHFFFSSILEALKRIKIEKEERNIEFSRKDKALKEKEVISKKLLKRLRSQMAQIKNELKNVEENIVAKKKQIKLLKKSSKNEEDKESTEKLAKIATKKNELLDQREQLRICIQSIDVELSEKERELRMSQNSWSDITKKKKEFLKFCKSFESKAKIFLSGEIVEGYPTELFTKAHKIVNKTYGLSKLKEKFELIVKDKDMCDDKKIFIGYKSCIDESRTIYSNKAFIGLQDKINKELSLQKSFTQEVSGIQQEMKSVEEKYSMMLQEKKNSEIELSSVRSRLSKTFCKLKLEKLEIEWQNSSFEDSLNCAIKYIDHALSTVKQDWSKSIDANKNNKELEKELKALNEHLCRLIRIEENRILGFPRENGARQGRMPVYDKRAELQMAMKKSNAVIVTAGTGCGKSTQLPQYIVDDFYSHSTLPINSKRNFFRICCTQPRRLAAQGVAKRVAEEYDTKLGDMVGFRVGSRGAKSTDSQKVSKNTRIEFVTEGLLLYQLTRSPEKISNYDCVIVDEAHERNKETDLLLAHLRQLLQDPQNKIKLVVMSATINPARFSQYFGGCPTMDCPGRNHHVDEIFVPSPEKMQNSISYRDTIDINHAVNVLFDKILGKYEKPNFSNFEKGDVLIFLSSSAQITLCVDKINSRAKDEGMPFVVAYPLFAQMPEKDKDAAKNPNHRTGLDNKTDGCSEFSRKVICCTNIAETSLTIERIRFVIEGGYAKKPIYDHTIRSKAISEREISQASAKQRKGRAGRTAPGKCYYLYSKASFENRKEYDLPQILDTLVDDLIMYSLNVCSKSVEHLGLMDEPNEEEIDKAKQRLTDLDMIKIGNCGSVSLTEDGKIACRLSSLDVQAVRMILTARKPELNCLHRAIKLAAILSSEDDIFTSNRSKNGDESLSCRDHDLGDHFLMLSILEKYEEKKKNITKMGGNKEKKLRNWCRENGLIYYVIDRIQNTVEQCYKEMKKYNFLKEKEKESPCSSPHFTKDDNGRLLEAFISGYFSQIAEYIDPFFYKLRGFSILGQNHNSLNFRLAKESCLNNILDNEDFQDDDSDDEDKYIDTNSESNTCADSYKRTLSFVLYTNTFSIETKGKSRLVLTSKASLIDGKSIKTHVPTSWCSRVRFDENKPSICRRTISNIGTDFQRAALAFFREMNFEGKGVLLKIYWNKNKLRLYGSTENVSPVKASIEELISNQRQKRIKADLVSYFPDNSKFESGLELKSIGNSTPKEHFLVRKGVRNERVKDQNKRYWNIKDQYSNQVIIFINDDNDASIFSGILRKCLPKIQYNVCCKTDRIVHVNCRDSNNQLEPLGEVVRNVIQESYSEFLPEIVDYDISIASEHFSFSKESKMYIQEIWQCLGYEWFACIPFWRQFCTDLERESKSNVRVQVKYVPTNSCFEIYGAEEKLRFQLKNSLIKKLSEMCRHEKYWIHNPELENTKSSYWRITAIIREMRLLFSSIRFTLILKMNESSNNEGEVINFEDQPNMEQLLLVDNQEQMINSLSIKLQCPSACKNQMNKAKKMLENSLPSKVLAESISVDTEDNKQSEKKIQKPKCCMCKRELIYEQKSKTNRNSNCCNKIDVCTPTGYKLTLCGCFFCRQCFMNSIMIKLKSQTMAQCENCSSIILAKDCQNIINLFSRGNKQKKMSLEEKKYQADWKNVLTLSYENYCQHYVKSLPNMTTLICKGCNTVSLVPNRIKFIYCRNVKCACLICTNCGGGNTCLSTCENAS